MKLYRLTHLPLDGATDNMKINTWHASADAASKAKTAAKKADRTCNAEVTAVDVPTTKVELLKFLNEHNV